MKSMLVSIIIITLNEAENLELTIKHARIASQLPSGRSLPVEIIISDGGSDDDTISIAEHLADKVLHSSKGRAVQLNHGAKNSNGNILLFLHADTLLPEGAILRILHELKNPSVIGGGFKKFWKWDSNINRTKMIDFMLYIWQGIGNWLVRLLRTFPGDNAIFVRRSVFESLSGYAKMWICEDFDFILRMKKYIKNYYKLKRKRKELIVYIRSAVKTSTRRLLNYGFFNTIWMWFLIYWMWRLGMSQEKLKYSFRKYSAVPMKSSRAYINK